MALLFIFFLLAPLLFVPGYILGQLYCTLYNLPKAVFIIAGALLLVSGWLFYLSGDPVMAKLFLAFLRHNPGGWLLLTLFFWMSLSLFAATVPVTAAATLCSCLMLGLLWLVLSSLFLFRVCRWAAVWGLLAGGMGFVVVGLAQSYESSPSFLIPVSYNPASTFANRNMAAQFIVFSLPFLFFTACRVWRLGRRGEKAWFMLLAGLILLAVGFLVLLFEYASQNGLLALVVEVLFFFLAWYWFRSEEKKGLETKSQRRILFSLAGALVGVAVVASLALSVPRFRGRLLYSWHQFQQKGLAGALRGRYQFWGNTLVMIRDHPLIGVGAGNFPVVYPLYCRSFAWDTVTGYKKRARKAHNDYLQVAAECGIPALAILLLLLGRQFYLLKIPEKPDPDDPAGESWVGDWRLPLGASLAAYAVVMCFSFPLQLAYSRMFFFFLLALGEARAWRASLT